MFKIITAIGMLIVGVAVGIALYVLAVIKWLAGLLGGLALLFALFTHHPAHCLEIAAVCFVVVLLCYLPLILIDPAPRSALYR
jgi:hypothetical protein